MFVLPCDINKMPLKGTTRKLEIDGEKIHNFIYPSLTLKGTFSVFSVLTCRSHFSLLRIRSLITLITSSPVPVVCRSPLLCTLPQVVLCAFFLVVTLSFSQLCKFVPVLFVLSCLPVILLFFVFGCSPQSQPAFSWHGSCQHSSLCKFTSSPSLLSIFTVATQLPTLISSATHLWMPFRLVINSHSHLHYFVIKPLKSLWCKLFVIKPYHKGQIYGVFLEGKFLHGDK